jgi:hypothetical protein
MERFVPETPFWVAAVLVFSALVLIAVARRKMIAGVA